MTTVEEPSFSQYFDGECRKEGIEVFNEDQYIAAVMKRLPREKYVLPLTEEESPVLPFHIKKGSYRAAYHEMMQSGTIIYLF